MTAKAVFQSRWFGVAIVLCILAWGIFDRTRYAQPGDIVAQSDFAAQYSRTWEMLEKFSRCGAKADLDARLDAITDAQSAFAALRTKIRQSGFATQSRIIDRQFQLYSQPGPKNAISAIEICKRVTFLGPVDEAQVRASIAATQQLVEE